MSKIAYTPDHYYHIYNRGVNRGPIFFAKRNWFFFIQRLREYFTEETAVIIAYCLMPNHYYLLVRLLCDDFGRAVMQPFSTSYTKPVIVLSQFASAAAYATYVEDGDEDEKAIGHLLFD